MPMTDSRDGTKLGYTVIGDGPGIVLVEGALGYRGFGATTRLAEKLAGSFTVLTYDRRGRGESTTSGTHEVDREIEDIEALVAVLGPSASLYGISSGACLALEAAARLQSRVTRLALYEPPYDDEPADDDTWAVYGRDLEAAIAEDRRGDAVELFMSFVGTPQEMIAGMKNSPAWAQLEALAPTLLDDRAAMGGEARWIPGATAGRIAVPTLVCNGQMTLPFIARTAQKLADLIPNGRHVELEGQTHDVDPSVLAPVLAEFFAG